MASEAQIVANRLNAEKSTGPRTAEGKAVVSQNAVTHGLLARQAVICGEDPGEFEFYRGRMVGELAPVGAMESMLAERVVGLSWRLRRAERVQNEAFDVMHVKDREGPLARLAQSLLPKGADRPGGDPGPGDGDSVLGRVVVNDFSHARVLDRLLMYERRIEHSLYRTMTELQRLRLLRELDGPMEKPTPKPGRPGGDDLSRETEPAARDRNAESPARRETAPSCAKQSQFSPDFGRPWPFEAGKSEIRSSKSERVSTAENEVYAENKANPRLRGDKLGGAQMNCRSEKGVCESMRIVENKPNSHQGAVARDLVCVSSSRPGIIPARTPLGSE
jgi:hypothetical protein